jgi:hypothetical protein
MVDQKNGEDKPRIYKKWEDTEFEPLYVVKKDGSHWLVHPDGTEEKLSPQDKRYRPWH